MQKPLTFLAPFAFIAALALPAAAQNSDNPSADPATVVATVNGTEITLGHMIVAWASLPQQYQDLPDDVLFKGILDQLIQQTALTQNFKGDLPARVALQLENERRSLTAGEAVNGIMEGELTDADVQAAYDAQYSDVAQEQEFNASHILVETQEEAEEIRQQIADGGDFAELAREKSTGPSGPNGGQLGWFGKGRMVPEFEAAAMELEPGAVSDPVQTQFGWHVIKLNETRLQAAPPLETVREEIEMQIRQTRAQEMIVEITEAADVNSDAAAKIDPAAVKQLELVE